MTNKPSIAISLVNIDSFQLLNPALTSLIESDLKEFDFKLFYWDNGSKDESVSFIESLEINKLVIKSDSNLGIVEPRIDLMDKIIAEDCWELVLEIHSDMLFPNIWLKPLLTKFDDNTGILLPYIIQQNE
ncbi:MAG: glycosyltransferase, partial [Candidatus Brocadiaceae bacterium]|nr:glycosyltransferase [Candidatus Brocadiaceae bacterium]